MTTCPVYPIVRLVSEQRISDPLSGCEPTGPRILQLRPDRRLGHEWDDWDGQPLPNDGVYHEPPGLFLALIGAWFGAVALGLAAALWLVAPRLASLWEPLPSVLWAGWGIALGALGLWMGAVAIAVRTSRNFLPRSLAEGGMVAWLLPLAERAGRWFGISRDRAGNAGVRVYNRLAAARARPGIKPERLLILLPRCLDKDSMQRAMALSARYGVPLFVASRGRYAREMIERTRPEAVVAVACERDLVSGIHDVAPRLPVLGTTLSLPEGPCKNTGVAIDALEAQIRNFLGLTADQASPAAAETTVRHASQ